MMFVPVAFAIAGFATTKQFQEIGTHGRQLLMLVPYASHLYNLQVNADLHAKIEAAGSLKGGEVAKNAANDALCKQAVDIFFTAYASEAGNALLKWLPTGGFYLTGGIAAKNIDRFGPDSGVWQGACLLRSVGCFASVTALEQGSLL